MKFFVGRGFQNRNCHVLIEFLTFELRQKLPGIVVFGVRGEKSQRQAKRLVRRTPAQKFQRVVFIFLRDMNRRAVRLLHPMRAGVDASEIEVLL